MCEGSIREKEYPRQGERWEDVCVRGVSERRNILDRGRGGKMYV